MFKIILTNPTIRWNDLKSKVFLNQKNIDCLVYHLIHSVILFEFFHNFEWSFEFLQKNIKYQEI